jgi:hypothetical protein
VSAFTVSWGLLVGLLAVVFLDLGFRYLAFGQVESVAIDIALFASVFSLVELARQVDNYSHLSRIHTNSGDLFLWSVRAAVDVVCLLVLVLSHKFLRDLLDRRIERKFISRLVGEANEVGRTSLQLVYPLVTRSVLLTLTGTGRSKRLREGKQRWLIEVVDYLNHQFPGQTRPQTSSGIEKESESADLTFTTQENKSIVSKADDSRSRPHRAIAAITALLRCAFRKIRRGFARIGSFFQELRDSDSLDSEPIGVRDMFRVEDLLLSRVERFRGLLVFFFMPTIAIVVLVVRIHV